MSNRACECVEPVAVIAPESVVNSAGADRFRYRVGTHSSLLAALLQRLAGGEYPTLAKCFRARNSADPTMALLDAWCTAADALTFYSERIANEGYLRTATERRSLAELSKLVGYRLAPGVAASVLLAFTLEEGTETTIPAGTPARSVPDGPEFPLPQTFETSTPLFARAEWNSIRPRQTRPPHITPGNIKGLHEIYLQGIATQLEVGDRLFIYPEVDPEIDASDDESDPEVDDQEVTQEPELFRVTAVNADSAQWRTRVSLEHVPTMDAEHANQGEEHAPRHVRVLPELVVQVASRQGANDFLKSARNRPISADCRVLSRPLQLFGYNAPRVLFNKQHPEPGNEWESDDEKFRLVHLAQVTTVFASTKYLALIRDDGSIDRFPVEQHFVAPRSDYGLNSQCTVLELHADWRREADTTIKPLRTTLAIVEVRELALADVPIPDPVESDQILLDGFYAGLHPGKHVIITGTRISGPRGQATEARLIRSVQHELSDLPGDAVHTRIFLSQPLDNVYQRETVAIMANVVRATHGESVRQILATGNATGAFPRFALARQPLTFLPAPVSAGAASTLRVVVNEVEWRETASLFQSASDEQVFTLEIDDAGVAAVRIGNGRHGARLPTGSSAIVAMYRAGLGRAGNVAAGKINQLASRPLGVIEVVNPLAATGGADPESTDQVREHAPLAVLALDRVVSVGDYADFARGYAAIEKADARLLMCRGRRIVHVTVAGADEMPIETGSELVRNLLDAYRRWGDSRQLVQVDGPEHLLVLLGARIRLEPGRDWLAVERQVRRRLVDALGFRRQDLGQPLYLSDAIHVIQRTPGVAYVDVDAFNAVTERQFAAALDASTSRVADDESLVSDEHFSRLMSAVVSPVIGTNRARLRGNRIVPAQLACLRHEIPGLIRLAEIAR